MQNVLTSISNCYLRWFRKKSSHRWKPVSRIPGENREPVFKMVPGVRRDYDWIPAFAGMTVSGLFRLFTTSSTLQFIICNVLLSIYFTQNDINASNH